MIKRKDKTLLVPAKKTQTLESVLEIALFVSVPDNRIKENHKNFEILKMILDVVIIRP